VKIPGKISPVNLLSGQACGLIRPGRRSARIKRMAGGTRCVTKNSVRPLPGIRRGGT
jgi:hypothetical protein